MATVTKVNQQTIIGLEETSRVGGAPMRYYVSENVVPAMDQTMTPFGSLKAIPNNDIIPERSQPTRLNELDPSFRLPGAHAYLGSETIERSHVDNSTDLRFGGRERCKKSEQLTGELTTHRYNFMSPTGTVGKKDGGNKYATEPLLITSSEFHIGNYGVNQPIPNYEKNGNNVVDIRAQSTRSALIDANRLG